MAPKDCLQAKDCADFMRCPFGLSLLRTVGFAPYGGKAKSLGRLGRAMSTDYALFLLAFALGILSVVDLGACLNVTCLLYAQQRTDLRETGQLNFPNKGS